MWNSRSQHGGVLVVPHVVGVAHIIPVIWCAEVPVVVSRFVFILVVPHPDVASDAFEFIVVLAENLMLD